jgi:hypothetical protein
VIWALYGPVRNSELDRVYAAAVERLSHHYTDRPEAAAFHVSAL